MNEDHLRYDRMVEKALRSVVREALSRVAETKALPGDHHFFITFLTEAEGVKIPEYLHKQYPEEMTIVLQYQFYNLMVTEEALHVTLSFNNKLEDLIIPFEAITTFADPAVSFALQFQNGFIGEEDEEDEGYESYEGKASASNKGNAKPPRPAGGAEVVTLDAFRKNKQG